LILLAFAPRVATAKSCCTTVDKPGRWTLPELGFDGFEVPVRGDRTKVTVHYRLPPGSRQGRDLWYVIRLHFAISLEPGSGAGEAWVSAVTNGYAGVLVKFKRRGRDREVAWNSLDLIRGWVDGTTRSRRIGVDVNNYLPFRGVRPGRNSYTVTLRRAGALRIERLRVLEDSGLEVTRRGPARLALEPILPNQSIRPGERFKIGYRLRNVGDRDARQVVVRIAADQHGGPRVIGSDRRRLGRVREGATGTFRLKAQQAGRYRLLLGADSSASHPRRAIEVPVVSAGRRPAGRALRVAAAGALLVGGLVLLAMSRGRRQSPPPPSSPD
jgi:hypothetical protein